MAWAKLELRSGRLEARRVRFAANGINKREINKLELTDREGSGQSREHCGARPAGVRAKQA